MTSARCGRWVLCVINTLIVHTKPLAGGSFPTELVTPNDGAVKLGFRTSPERRRRRVSSGSKTTGSQDMSAGVASYRSVWLFETVF